MPLTSARRTTARPLAAAVTLVALALTTACSADRPTEQTAGVPRGASPSASASASATPSSPSQDAVPQGWTPTSVDGITFLLPPGMEQTDRAKNEGRELVYYMSPGDLEDVPFLRLAVDRRDFGPFDLNWRTMTTRATADLEAEPDMGPVTVPVLGAARAERADWSWVGGEPEVPHLTSYTLVEKDSEVRYLLQLFGPRAVWPEDHVETLLGSVSVEDEDAA